MRNLKKVSESHVPLVFIIFQKDSPLLCLFILEQNQKQRDYFMLVSPVLPNPSELLSVFSSSVMAVRSKYSSTRRYNFQRLPQNDFQRAKKRKSSDVEESFKIVPECGSDKKAQNLISLFIQVRRGSKFDSYVWSIIWYHGRNNDRSCNQITFIRSSEIRSRR